MGYYQAGGSTQMDLVLSNYENLMNNPYSAFSGNANAAWSAAWAYTYAGVDLSTKYGAI